MRPSRNTQLATLRAAAAAVALSTMFMATVAATGSAWGQATQRIVPNRSSDPLAMCGRGTQLPEFQDRAVVACTTALEDRKLPHRDRVNTYINRGVLHLRRKEGEAALADFDAAIALDPRHAEAHLNRGGALMMLRQPALAVSAITASMSFGVSYPHKAYYNRAAAREALGDIRGAYEDYSAALSIQPDWGLAEAELARFARNRREQLAAQLEAIKAEGGTPPSPKGTP